MDNSFLYDDICDESPAEEKKEDKIFTYNEALEFNKDQLKIIKAYTKQLEAIRALVEDTEGHLPEKFTREYKKISWRFPLV